MWARVERRNDVANRPLTLRSMLIPNGSPLGHCCPYRAMIERAAAAFGLALAIGCGDSRSGIVADSRHGRVSLGEATSCGADSLRPATAAPAADSGYSSRRRGTALAVAWRR